MQNVKAYFVSHRMLHKVQEIEETKTKSKMRKKIILRVQPYNALHVDFNLCQLWLGWCKNTQFTKKKCNKI